MIVICGVSESSRFGDPVPSCAILTHLLLHYLKFLSGWDKAFSRLVGIVRSAVWMDLDIVETLRLHGIASPKHGGAPPQLWNKTT